MNNWKRQIGLCLACWAALPTSACENVDAYLGANELGVLGKVEADGGIAQEPVADSSSVKDFLGSWQRQDTQPGYASYMVIENEQGFFCCEDGKSLASFPYAPADDGQLTLGSYGYGTGDTLSLDNNGDTLQRTSVEKGETYTTTYVEASTVPAWCQQQIDSLRQPLNSGAEAFLGLWQKQDTLPGYESYMVIENERGFFCCEDGKSQASFPYAPGNGGQLTLGSYGYGTGDTLNLASSGDTLQRTSVEKGETYTSVYVEAGTVPAWCQQQIDSLR